LCITQVINGTTGYKLKMFAAIAESVVSREEYGCNLKDIMWPIVRICGNKLVRYSEYEEKLAYSVIKNYL
jgi:hypothetical protein